LFSENVWKFFDEHEDLEGLENGGGAREALESSCSDRCGDWPSRVQGIEEIRGRHKAGAMNTANTARVDTAKAMNTARDLSVRHR